MERRLLAREQHEVQRKSPISPIAGKIRAWPTILSSVPPFGPSRALRAGKPVEEVQRELGLERVVKLASNEGQFGPFPEALEAIERGAPG